MFLEMIHQDFPFGKQGKRLYKPLQRADSAFAVSARLLVGAASPNPFEPGKTGAAQAVDNGCFFFLATKEPHIERT